jgi:hypothetical protein
VYRGAKLPLAPSSRRARERSGPPADAEFVYALHFEATEAPAPGGPR